MGRKPNQRSPKKQSFFKVLLGNFSKHLRIPPKFTKKYIRPSLSKCSLRGPSGQCWNVELEKTENGMFFHNDGWHSFVKDNLLKIGDFLVFRYDGESKFKVKIFDRTCCEKDIEVVKRRSGCPASPANEGNQLAGVQDEEVIDLETEIYKKHTEKKTRTAGRRIRNNVMPGEGLGIEGVNETSTGSILFKSENSCFKLTLKRSYQQYVVAVPKEISVAEGLMNKKAVKIQDPTGKPWPAKLVTIKCKQNNGNQIRLDMSTGWGECCTANKILVGDTVVFEFVRKTVLQLHIFRKGLGKREGKSPFVVLDAPNMKN